MTNDDVKITILEDGLRIITQKADFNNTFIGVWVKVGLINETDKENGLSHFLEHMLFKGTKTKNAMQLSDYIERLGGECNAYTSLENTVLHTCVLPEHWKFGVDFLADVIQNSVFPEEEIERERNVILQEISMYENDPSSEITKQLMKSIYAGDPFGRDVLGTRKNVSKFTRDDLIRYFEKWYTPNNMVISACGDIDHDEFVAYISKQFKSGFRAQYIENCKQNTFKYNTSKKQNIFSQSHFILSTEGQNFHTNEREKLVFTVLGNIIDGGMSCRLFQEIREKHGLAYEVSFLNHTMENTGFFGIHAFLDEKNIEQAVQLSKEVLASIKTNIELDEMEKAKNAVLYSLASSYDSCYKLASTNGMRLLFDVERKNYQQIKEIIRNISLCDLFEYSEKYIPDIDSNRYALTIMTPYETERKQNV